MGNTYFPGHVCPRRAREGQIKAVYGPRIDERRAKGAQGRERDTAQQDGLAQAPGQTLSESPIGTGARHGAHRVQNCPPHQAIQDPDLAELIARLDLSEKSRSAILAILRAAVGDTGEQSTER